jgi:hypothetical protein
MQIQLKVQEATRGFTQVVVGKSNTPLAALMNTDGAK